MYEDNDFFGVEEYTQDFEYIFDMMKIPVKYIKKNQEATDEYQPGDFLGINTEEFKPEVKTIYIVVNTRTKNRKETTQYGFENHVEEFEAIAKKDDEIKHNDEIEIGDKNYVIEIDSSAEFQFKPAFIKFKLQRQK